MIEEITKNQPDSIVHAIKASFMFFDRFGMPPIDPESVFVVSATNRGGGCIVLETLHVDEMTAVFRLLRRQDARPAEINPAAAQYDSHATPSSVRAEYRRRGWKLPKLTRWERS